MISSDTFYFVLENKLFGKINIFEKIENMENEQLFNGCVPFATIASNLLAFSSKMADVAATSTDKRSVTLLTTYNTRSVHAVTQRAQQNLRHFTAIRPCFQQFAVDNMDDNVSRSNITTILNQFASNC